MNYKKNSLSETVGTIVSNIFILALLICSFLPFFWMIFNSLKSNREIYANPLNLPKKFDFTIFKRVWDAGHFSIAFKNSVLVTVICLLIIILVASLAAFALSHMAFRGRLMVLAAIIGAQIVSGQVLLIPLFKLMKDMNLLGSIYSVILVDSAIGIPMSVFLFWGFFKGMSREIYESTKIDGCTDIKYYRLILMPLSKPIIASVMVFQALFVWNEYLFALTFLREPGSRTIPLQLQIFFSAYTQKLADLFAALSISVIPVLLLYILLQKFFIKGLTAGAVKG